MLAKYKAIWANVLPFLRYSAPEPRGSVWVSLDNVCPIGDRQGTISPGVPRYISSNPLQKRAGGI